MIKRMVVAVAVGVLATVGLLVNTQSAEAAGWRTLHRWSKGSVFLVCQYTETGGYGPVWHTRLVLAHQPGEAVVHLRGSFTVWRMTSGGSYRVVSQTDLATDQAGQWDVRDAYGSQIGGSYGGRWYPDRWSYGVGDERGGLGDVSKTPFTAISHC